MKMGWISGKIFERQLSIALINSNFYHDHEITKKLKKEIKQSNRHKTCHMCHINAWNTACLKSYLAFYFKCLNHVQNLIIKNSIFQELNYVQN